MKKEIHPAYHQESAVTCSCGEKFVVGSTMPKIDVEICSSCHPFFTGEEKVLDQGGRVERFKKRAAATTPAKKK
ncbi:MAG: 50S ribosomal protein L31 [Parcubacteria group bacterium GW2011_GWA1_44_13]|uniref:Large ribosomal subunit protein bL31 n=1 Tax=Candidatus Nomurabacteria bacterium GW2011_GWB1_44_12 TaxID=1618748 RepID=A0A837ICK2_9BACT|nr:MAG: 50S ribosomal protein L31 [Candidatus Nomurabacteria bacterium GW2011_GWD1_44_10]KKT37196.1 MAG: 50S ribosomal protein L31 [Candidatus Nomurabacteria bacterium GW2011_GWB1_44_12]KKT38508.1 MAG: 50S ribosomal protein L31 [Parcubacteria group bacterium GW2011_GWA1_44_13]KKT60496.1 MAG: 50S ribosomal protein L31 [Parcubacteria group bacterium GW2011_GWC1_44_26]HBB44335.1 50S ribosomal protein L31 [Candidatus Yonathbacteria bacterium]